MKHLIAFFLLIFSANYAAALCQGRDLTDTIRASDPDAFARAEARAAATPYAEGLLWEITKDGLPASYLFGTYHLGTVSDTPRTLQARDLAVAARTMFIEIAPEEEAAMQGAFATEPQLFMNTEAMPLSTWLSPELLQIAEARLPGVGLNETIAGVLKPWMLSLLLALPPCVLQERAAGRQSMDQELASAAADAGVSVAGLETWRAQIGIFAEASVEDQRDGVRLQLASTLDPADLQATMQRYYQREKIMLIWELSLMEARRMITDRDVDAIAAEWWDLIVVERNRNMAATALPELQQGGVFMAVGALHLPGEAGLIELMRGEGFTVTRLP
ncbi:MAG: TraB/GumN family protein [Pseudomonadota bacterium]